MPFNSCNDLMRGGAITALIFTEEETGVERLNNFVNICSLLLESRTENETCESHSHKVALLQACFCSLYVNNEFPKVL